VEHPYIQEEFSDICASLERDRERAGAGFWAPFKGVFLHKSLVKRVGIAVSLFAWQNGTAINAINYY
jgi:hypothetical protein